MRTVAIVGAGPSGLVSAKVLLADGFDVTLFEKGASLGGIWSFEGSYYNLHTQQPGGTMEYSDLYDGEEYTSWEHVHEYLCKYATFFNIMPRIRFRTEVLSISKPNLRDSDQQWSVKIKQISSSTETLTFDFVVIASGLFSHYEIPVFRGAEKFGGSIVHANFMKKREQFLDKNILVVGGSKTAVDMAINAATVTNRCHMVFRRIHLILPMKILLGHLPLRYILCRFYSIFREPYPFAPHGRFFYFALRYFPWLFATVRKLLVADLMASNEADLYVDGIFQPKNALKAGLVGFPTSPLFTELKRKDRIKGHLASIDEILDSTTVRLDNGTILSPIDTIICGTSRPVRFPFFSDADIRTMGLPYEESDDVDLYRRLVPVDVPNIAFAGLIAATKQWMVTEVASHWISDYFKGLDILPNREEMQNEIRTMRHFARSRFSSNVTRVVFYSLEQIEIYLKDMGLPLRRTKNWWTENFGVYRPDRLRTLQEERRRRDLGRPISNQFYFSFFYCLLILFVVFIGIRIYLFSST